MEAQSRSRWRHNLDQDGGTTMFFITEEAKEAILDFSRRTVKVL